MAQVGTDPTDKEVRAYCERRRKEDEANRPRRLEQDAVLSTLTKDEYRTLLEAVLATHIKEKAEKAGDDWEEGRLLDFEINGICVALRLLGGYEGVAFDEEWAKTIQPAPFDWTVFLFDEQTSVGSS